MFSPDDIFIAVMGMTGAGKTRFVTNCTGQAIPEFQSLESCKNLSLCYNTWFIADHPIEGTMGLTMHTMSVSGLEKRVCLIDTPGFDDTNRSDADILQEMAFWLVKSYEVGTHLSGIIYLHRITDVRLGGSAVRGLNIFKAMCGADNFHGVTMATTFWDKVHDFDKAREDNRQLMSSPNFWKDLADGKCTTRSLTAGKSSAIELVTAIARSDKRLILTMQRQIVDEGLRIYETDAGKVLRESWFQEKSDLCSKLADTREELIASMAANKTGRQQTLQSYYDELSSKIAQRNAAIEELSRPTEVITDVWTEKAIQALELRKMQHDDITFKLEQAMTFFDQESSHSPEYETQKDMVDALFEELEEADRLQSIQIASFSVKLNKASLDAALISGMAGIISAGAAIVPLIPVLVACNVM
jgi:hypothetical protein